LRRVFAKGLLLAVSLAASLIAAEQVLRLVGYEYRPVSIDVANTEDARYYHLFGSDHFIYDPELIWKPKPGSDVFNREGFRGPLMGQVKGADRLRIVTIGDSNTLGWAGPDGPNWPQSLGRILSDEGISAEVVNAGVWGYSSLQGLARLRQVLPFDPDIVLVSFGSNDAVQVAIPDRRFSGKSVRRRKLERWFTHYRLGQLMTAVINATAAGGNGLVSRVGLDEYSENLREMARLAAENGARIVFLTRPFELQIPDDVWWKNFGYDYNVATGRVAVEVGAPLVDFYTHFKGRRDLFADESHFTDEGHELAARIARTELAPLLGSASGTRRKPRSRRSAD